MARPSYAKRPLLEVTAKEAHQIWGHPNVKAVKKLQQAINGVKLKDGLAAPKWDECVTCIKAKLHKFVSRRAQRVAQAYPFQRLGINIVQLQKRGEACYNGDIWLLHAVCPSSNYHFATTTKHKNKAVLSRWLERLLAKIKRQFYAKVQFVKLDDDRGYSDLYNICEDNGLIVEPRAAYVEEQNGVTEKVGHTIII